MLKGERLKGFFLKWVVLLMLLLIMWLRLVYYDLAVFGTALKNYLLNMLWPMLTDPGFERVEPSLVTLMRRLALSSSLV